jgi:hypothetical protein
MGFYFGKKKREENNVIYWSEQDIKEFFGLNNEKFDTIVEKAKEYLSTQSALIEINHFNPDPFLKLTRQACFSIAKVLDKNKILSIKSEFSQYYFGAWPCNLEAFTKRVQKGRQPGAGSIVLDRGADNNGFNFLFRL